MKIRNAEPACFDNGQIMNGKTGKLREKHLVNRFSVKSDLRRFAVICHEFSVTVLSKASTCSREMCKSVCSSNSKNPQPATTALEVSIGHCRRTLPPRPVEFRAWFLYVTASSSIGRH